MNYRVVHADDRLVVVDKPSGLLSQPGIGPDKQDCLERRVAADFDGARIVHRLDRDTSGLMVLARDAKAHRHLSMQFQRRQVSKRYIALVAGCPEEEAGEVDLPLRLDLDNKPRQIVDHAQGKAALTRWRVIERLPDRTHMELEPLTGRSHQLRLHMQQIGHPILGDPLYAPAEVQAMAPRLCLHAAMLAVRHPADGREMAFELPCPF